MSTKIFILDTSYLIEIAGCGRDSNVEASKKILAMFRASLKARARFFVPLPCLFELGDHIADVAHGGRRSELAAWLVQTVRSSLECQSPFIITPAGNPTDVLPKLMERFLKDCPKSQLGLVDCFTVDEAIRVKTKISALKPKVHIWTNDRALKAKEPDEEQNAYLW